ncbi:GMC oxidoreductase [Planctomyces sp. SH-PL62]|uniref:GMC oxidoreductase n=1 Tax=Planctomyces sp. SH-PL62 TaxID=1636152 RepID=UPI00078B9F48|nr:GMC oxidoreductase [Planctomyces sp. SH-PL62]AMV39723.1 Oxygen-dependent choline dehydrogenase [Planctomyces sp. SH-PL62]
MTTAKTNVPHHEGYDYIVVGSGAGGGPLAARLALKGYRVLVIEAGSHGDPGRSPEVSLVPGLHAASTEDPALSWRFFVKHYDDPPAGVDPKWHLPDRAKGENETHEGIFYPRAAALGGCTVHNALITIAGPDADWDELSVYLEDDSWRSTAMRPYFQKLERNQYLPRPRPVPSRFLGRFRDGLWWLLGKNVDHTGGKHGYDGWLHTSVLDLQLGLGDRQLIGMLKAALWQAKSAGLDRAWTWVRTILRGRASEGLDPNHATTQAESPEGVVLIPLAACGEGTSIHEQRTTPNVRRGRRSSPREFLLEVREAHPDRLHIWTDCLATRVLFSREDLPRAVGVELRRGARLYRAHVVPSPDEGKLERAFVKPTGEVVLCGGSFNTPQLLMLSGIGDSEQLAKAAAEAGDPKLCALCDGDGHVILDQNEQPSRIHLTGVGRNLQDRYEVSLVSEMKAPFSLLEGATLKDDDADPSRDPHLQEWRKEGTGLYSTNGAVLGLFKRSSPNLVQPDLFIFGAPLPFKGYAVGYSDVGHIHDMFSWVILKAKTRNNGGTVRLRSTDPRDTPEINFHYFNEADRRGKSLEDPDLDALVQGVKFVRGISRNAGLYVKRESHPGVAEVPTDDEAKIKAWILREAWGHHACGTCRMGPEGDPSAVLDSRFGVRGVDGLRVVDASIFPQIPGYFLVTNIYMASEKAADVLIEDARQHLRDAPEYPEALRRKESIAIGKRRDRVNDDAAKADLPLDSIDGETPDWPDDVTGLALSGGGVRSATFNLGVLQALARAKRLRKVDFLSTVSGGGYVGSFLGRCFDRLRQAPVQGLDGRSYPPGPSHVEGELVDPGSPEIAWLRRQSNYLAPSGAGDERVNAANYFRNLVSVHLVVGILFFTLFGLMQAIRYGVFSPSLALFKQVSVGSGGMPFGDLIRGFLGPFYSPWFLLAEVLFLTLVLPLGVGYWLVCQHRQERFHGLMLSILVFVASGLVVLGLYYGLRLEPLLLALSLLLAFWHVELAWYRGRIREAAVGVGDSRTQRLRTRNLLTHDLGFALVLTAGALLLAVVDSIGFALQQYAARKEMYVGAFATLLATIAGLVPLGRALAGLFVQKRGTGVQSSSSRDFHAQVVAGLLAAVLFTVPLVLYSFAAHAAFGGGDNPGRGIIATLCALAYSLILAHPAALTFVNRSSFSEMYAARLARAYLGASNPERRRPGSADVTEVIPGDDVGSLKDYRPYEMGGPLHLINLTVNQTIDFSSFRGNRDRKGESLAVSPIGMTVGKRWHAAWGADAGSMGDPGARNLLDPLGVRPGSDHPALDVVGDPSGRVEMLSLREWVALSGAAIGPGRGQSTRLGTALLFGLANLRTGYWWDSGITLAGRRGFPDLSVLRRMAYAVSRTFLTHTLLVSEWLALYPGPWARYWHVSDGGFFENLGGYELIRRQVPRIIVCDASADPAFTMEGLGELIRKVRIDFDAHVEPFTDADLDDLAARNVIPPEVRALLGTIDELRPAAGGGPSRKHAALFRVRYDAGSHASSLLLYLKASVTGDESVDVLQYRTLHGDFPHESTSDQFFDEAQWESYRKLGEHAASGLLTDPDWFWRVKVKP